MLLGALRVLGEKNGPDRVLGPEISCFPAKSPVLRPFLGPFFAFFANFAVSDPVLSCSDPSRARRASARPVSPLIRAIRQIRSFPAVWASRRPRSRLWSPFHICRNPLRAHPGFIDPKPISTKRGGRMPPFPSDPKGPAASSRRWRSMKQKCAHPLPNPEFPIDRPPSRSLSSRHQSADFPKM